MEKIINAAPSDAKIAVELLNLALEDIAYDISGTKDLEETRRILEDYFSQKGNRISYEFVKLFVKDNAIAGVICIYEGSLQEKFDKIYQENIKARFNKDIKLDRECKAGELYIDCVAVDENFRRQGIATKLIEHSFIEAKNQGLDKVSLVVDEDKPKTRAFYEKLGFKFDKDLIISKHKYHRMMKEIK